MVPGTITVSAFSRPARPCSATTGTPAFVLTGPGRSPHTRTE